MGVRCCAACPLRPLPALLCPRPLTPMVLFSSMLKLSRVNRDSRFDLPTPVAVHFQQHAMRRPRSTGQSSGRVSGPSGHRDHASVTREAAASVSRLTALRRSSPESPTSTILNRWSNAVPVAGVAMAAGRGDVCGRSGRRADRIRRGGGCGRDEWSGAGQRCEWRAKLSG